MAVLYRAFQNCKLPQRPNISSIRMSKSWHICIMGHYTTVRSNEPLLPTRAWMRLIRQKKPHAGTPMLCDCTNMVVKHRRRQAGVLWFQAVIRRGRNWYRRGTCPLSAPTPELWLLPCVWLSGLQTLPQLVAGPHSSAFMALTFWRAYCISAILQNISQCRFVFLSWLAWVYAALSRMS